MSIVNIQALKQLGNVLWWTGQIASANAPKAITSVGDCKQILPFPGAGIGMFDGTGDYLTVPASNDWNFGTGNFTVRFWIYLPVLPPTTATSVPFTSRAGNDASTSYQWMCPVISTTGIGITQVYFSSNNTNWDIGTLTIGTLSTGWNHIAIVRNGTSFTGYLNGVAGSPITSSASLYYNNTPIYIGAGFGGANPVSGFISEFEISNVARYTANFTPPRRQLESDSNTKLLIHFNRNDTTFIDSSPSAHTITRYGDAKQLCSPCGSGVAYFDGTGDNLTTPHHADFNFGTSSFTIELNIRFLSLSTDFQIPVAKYFNGVPNDRSWLIAINQSSIYFLHSTDGANGLVTNSTTAYTFSINTWYNIIVQRSGTTFTIWINGTRISNGSFTNTIYSTSNALTIGAAHNISISTYSNYVNGYISDLRISNAAKYDIDAMVSTQTQPFKPDPYTKLLLHMDGVGNAFYDSSDPPGDNGFPILPDGVTVTPNGAFAVQKMKDGRNIWYFNSTNTNYITVSDHDVWSFYSGDFTVCFWIKKTANNTYVIMAQWTGSDTNNYQEIAITNTNSIVVQGTSAGSSAFSYTTPTNTTVSGSWMHIAILRNGSNCLIYVDGVAKPVNINTAWGTIQNLVSSLVIGQILSSSYYDGNLKDLMIFKGRALTQDQIAAIMAETYIY